MSPAFFRRGMGARAPPSDSLCHAVCSPSYLMHATSIVNQRPEGVLHRVRRPAPARGSILPYFLLFCFFTAIAAFLQHRDQASVEINGVFIPDVMALTDTVDAYATNRLDGYQVKAVTGVTALYILPWKIWPPLVIALNLALVFFTLKIYGALFSVSNIGHHAAGIGVVFSSPYHYLAMTGANKEIPVMCFTALFLYLVIRRPQGWQAAVVAVAVVTYFFRDGYAFIFALAGITAAFFRESRAKFLWAGLTICVVTSGLFWFLQGKFAVLARNREVLEYVKDVGSTGGGLTVFSGGGFVGDVLGYFVRVVYNVLTLGVFPQFQTENQNVFALGIAYWLFGLVMLGSVTACVWVFVMRRSSAVPEVYVRISALILFFMLALGVSTYLQPRYSMPIIPAALGVCVLIKRRGAMLMGAGLTLCVLIIASYWVRGHPPSRGQPAEGISVFSSRL